VTQVVKTTAVASLSLCVLFSKLIGYKLITFYLRSFNPYVALWVKVAPTRFIIKKIRSGVGLSYFVTSSQCGMVRKRNNQIVDQRTGNC